MDARLLDYKLKELFCLTKKYKIEAINMLIDSIRNDTVDDVKAYY